MIVVLNTRPDDSRLPILGTEGLSDALLNRNNRAAVQHGANSLDILLHLFLLDLLICLSSHWIDYFSQARRRLFYENEDKDGILCAITLQLDKGVHSLAEKARVLLESLELPLGLHYHRNRSDPLDTAAEELMLLVRGMKDAAWQFQELRKAEREDRIQAQSKSESQAVKRLTILAAIFLPLSLTTGVLSMQSRLRDIHLILWDFVCICLDLGIIVFATFWISKPSRLPKALREIRSIYALTVSFAARGPRTEAHENQKWDTIWSVLSWPIVIIVAVALNFGMFGQAHIAWKILGYGVAASAGALVILGPLYVVLNALLSNPLAKEP